MHAFLEDLGIEAHNSGAWAGGWVERPGGKDEISTSPVDGTPIASVRTAADADYERVAGAALAAFREWSAWPAPRRGEVVREIGDVLRRHKAALAALVSLEMGKIRAESAGEVQEMIDMADFAVGLSRQLHGLTMHSERPSHRMYEQWHPLGPIGVITAFNFPVAVWAWNAFIAAVAGDTVVWKPSSKTPLTAVAVTNLIRPVLERHGVPGIMGLVIGSGSTVGERLLGDRRVPMISATGSCRMGRRIAEVVGKRLGRTLLELGGNNAIVAAPSANLDLLVRAVVFAAVGTTGQRCTSTRRLILHRSIESEVTRRLVAAYAQLRIGDPLAEGTLVGPLVDAAAAETMIRALDAARDQGGRVLHGGERLDGPGYPGGCYVRPCLVAARPDMPIVQEETFAPILYLMSYDGIDEAIAIQNGVDQGLSSAIFTDSLREAEAFLSCRGSDCGIANVNIGTSGAEIGGAFGGEKDTGGGREAGSDAWKAYMRRQTCTINWGAELPLAQGIRFE